MGSAGRSDDEVRRLMQQYEDALYRQSAALREQKESQRDAILAKLAARKKMKEESTRETAVTRELQQILHDQVIENIIYVYIYNTLFAAIGHHECMYTSFLLLNFWYFQLITFLENRDLLHFGKF